jgi:hypothetical protein
VDYWLGIHPEDRDIMGDLANIIHTANVEYEAALLGGKPYATGIGEQERQVPLVLGSKRFMLSNLRSKVRALNVRLGNLEDQFEGGTGMQPEAMYDRFRKAHAGAERAQEAAQIDALRGRGTTGAPAAAPAARPTEPAPAGGAIPYKTYFGR